MKRIVCFIKGHEWNLDAYNNGYDACDRCGYCEPIQYEDYFSVRWWIKDFSVRWWIKDHWRTARDRFLLWWSPCDDCGLRFGKHDENVDHIPF